MCRRPPCSLETCSSRPDNETHGGETPIKAKDFFDPGTLCYHKTGAVNKREHLISVLFKDVPGLLVDSRRNPFQMKPPRFDGFLNQIAELHGFGMAIIIANSGIRLNQDIIGSN